MITLQRPKTFPTAFTTVEDAITLDVSGYGAVGVQLTGTWAGTVSFEATVDGVTYVALNLVPSNSATAAASSTSNGAWTGNVAGFSIVRLRFSTATSGTVSAYLQGAGESGRY